ncbi:MAG: valine--tRNA ligase [Anaerolineales bacterium]
MNKHTLPKTYDFNQTEDRIYQMWEENGYFEPTNQPLDPDHDPSIKPFVISIPPPNVTGELHLGHALFVSMEDLMIRYHRMKGIPTLWVPGSDHAGIATQLQVEKDLMKTEGKRREDIGREAFVERTWEWKRKYGGIITKQIRRLGASCDWSRERFTLDNGLSVAVNEAFVRLYEKGLIYRGPRLINWSPGLQTAVSDLEVEYSEEAGKLYYFKYRIQDSDDFIPVATTRPETILGDTAVAVHPEDERFQQFIGQTALVPILDREIPVIADSYVDREFGTGALKITPGHDINDYEIGERHNLEIVSILNKDASINEHGGPYAGQDRFECRKNIWADMKEADLVIKETDYTLKVPRSQRGGEIIEPMISTQWFVKIKPLAEPALAAVQDGRIQIVPPDVLDTWFSSGLWPFSTLGWPEETPDLKYFYPTSVLETGYDILFFWVARMIMSGLEYTGQVPFHTVYLHGIIRDELGRKMSKTTGNVIDPLEVMDEMGTDALRFTLLVGSSPGKDTSVSLKKVEANRNFANKLWNATRLVLSLVDQAPQDADLDSTDWTLADSWIWARIRQLNNTANRLIEAYQYGEAGRQIYDFFWGEFADWYLEIAKIQVAEGGARAKKTAIALVKILDRILRLLHHEAISNFNLVMDIIRAIRNLRAEKQVKPGRRIGATITAGEFTETLHQQASTISALSHLNPASFKILPFLENKPEGTTALVVGPAEIFLPLSDLIDPTEEKKRLKSDLEEVDQQIDRLEKLLSSPFAQKAPPEVVQKERSRLESFKDTAEKIQSQLQELG